VYNDSENVAQLLMIFLFSDFIPFLATSGQLGTYEQLDTDIVFLTYFNYCDHS